MKKSLKHLVVIAIAGCLSVSSAMVSFADWVVDEYGRKGYLKEDGNYACDEWLLINGAWYYFDSFSQKESNTVTHDGYTLRADGTWDQSIPQKTHDEIRKMYLEDLYGNLSFQYDMCELSHSIVTEELWQTEIKDFADWFIELYPTLTPEDSVTEDEYNIMKMRIIVYKSLELGD